MNITGVMIVCISSDGHYYWDIDERWEELFSSRIPDNPLLFDTLERAEDYVKASGRCNIYKSLAE